MYFKKFNIVKKDVLKLINPNTNTIYSEETSVSAFIKYKCVTVAFIQKMEHAQRFSGRCISYRSRGKTSSILLRNKSYGVEIRLFINNPRLLIYK